ncbi:hypothetical protein AQJ46_48870 [Streptomyces canus]|uniref:Uncharacterized protein n=1 Tax=Streptomyces canus TaxID=58343 RepID=A0A101RKC7_9ACTN|nr:hypothetical protein AQJ46_48870 [Streptomyces canus]
MQAPGVGSWLTLLTDGGDTATALRQEVGDGRVRALFLADLDVVQDVPGRVGGALAEDDRGLGDGQRQVFLGSEGVRQVLIPSTSSWYDVDRAVRSRSALPQVVSTTTFGPPVSEAALMTCSASSALNGWWTFGRTSPMVQVRRERRPRANGLIW